LVPSVAAEVNEIAPPGKDFPWQSDMAPSSALFLRPVAQLIEEMAHKGLVSPGYTLRRSTSKNISVYQFPVFLQHFLQTSFGFVLGAQA